MTSFLKQESKRVLKLKSIALYDLIPSSACFKTSSVGGENFMDKRLVGIGLIGGIIAIVGVFGPWQSLSGTHPLTGEEISESASAWDSITESTVAGSQVGRETYCVLALVGGVLALIGALGVLASPGVKALAGILAIGGLLAIIGAGWGFSDIETGTVLGIEVSYGYGLYLCLVGGILGLVGAYGARK